MSKYAVQAVLAAASENDSFENQLKDDVVFEEVLLNILSLTDEEKSQIKGALVNEDQSAPLSEEVEERNNPGPGFGS